MSGLNATAVLIARLKLEAQIHAQEARTANATIAEIYQCVSGATGEPGNWHGAEPVRRLVQERDDWKEKYQLVRDTDLVVRADLEQEHEISALKARVAELEGDVAFLHKRRGELVIERDALKQQVVDVGVIAMSHPAQKDAARYRWLTEDHVDVGSREKCREILRRLPVMSYAAASCDIDIAMAALVQEGDTLKADVARAERFAKIGCAVERAAASLPEGYGLRIELEKGAGSIYLTNDDGNEIELPDDSSEPFGSQIEAAIDAAVAASQEAP